MHMLSVLDLRVRIPEDALSLLLEEMALAPGPCAVHLLNKPASDFDAYLGRAKIPKVAELGRKAILHSFRHTHTGRAALAVGGNVWLLPKMFGHKRMETSAHWCDPTAPEFMVLLPTRTEDRTDPRKIVSRWVFAGNISPGKSVAGVTRLELATSGLTGESAQSR